MSTTNRLAAQVLTQGDTAATIVYPGATVISLQLTAVVPYAALITDPQTRMVVRDRSSKQILGSCVVAGAGAARVFVTSYTTSALDVEVSSLRGTAIVQVDEITGIEARCGQAVIDTDDIVNGTIATAKIAPGAVTLAKMDGFANIKCLAFVGVAVPGPCACVGAVVGDRALMYFGATTVTGAGLQARPFTAFEETVTVNDQIQQATADDLSTRTFIVLLVGAIS